MHRQYKILLMNPNSINKNVLRAKENTFLLTRVTQIMINLFFKRCNNINSLAYFILDKSIIGVCNNIGWC